MLHAQGSSPAFTAFSGPSPPRPFVPFPTRLRSALRKAKQAKPPSRTVLVKTPILVSFIPLLGDVAALNLRISQHPRGPQGWFAASSIARNVMGADVIRRPPTSAPLKKSTTASCTAARGSVSCAALSTTKCTPRLNP